MSRWWYNAAPFVVAFLILAVGFGVGALIANADHRARREACAWIFKNEPDFDRRAGLIYLCTVDPCGTRPAR